MVNNVWKIAVFTAQPNILNILETFILLKCLAKQFQPKTSDKRSTDSIVVFIAKYFQNYFKNSFFLFFLTRNIGLR